jgi:hypothetical protein
MFFVLKFELILIIGSNKVLTEGARKVYRGRRVGQDCFSSLKPGGSLHVPRQFNVSKLCIPNTERICVPYGLTATPNNINRLGFVAKTLRIMSILGCILQEIYFKVFVV